METDAAMSISMLRIIAVEPTVRFGLNVMFAVIGPETVFCTNWPVPGETYVTKADEMVMVAPEYEPWSTFIRASGCIVPMRCIISTVVGEDMAVTEPPLLFANVIEPMAMLTATSRSDGASPIFTWREVVFGWGFCDAVVPPPQATNRRREMPTRNDPRATVNEHGYNGVPFLASVRIGTLTFRD
jgi:hypothetical protein